MSYEPTNWKAGDTVTSAKLNKLEQGVARAEVLFVNADPETDTLDRTWQEIYDAGFAVVGQQLALEKNLAFIYHVYRDLPIQRYVVKAAIITDDSGTIGWDELQFATDSADGYPILQGR